MQLNVSKYVHLFMETHFKMVKKKLANTVYDNVTQPQIKNQNRTICNYYND